MTARRIAYGSAVDSAKWARRAIRRGDVAHALFCLRRAERALGFAIGRCGPGLAARLLERALDAIGAEFQPFTDNSQTKPTRIRDVAAG